MGADIEPPPGRSRGGERPLGGQVPPGTVGAVMTPALCIVLHDVAPATWSACERVCRYVQSLAPAHAPLPMTLLAVPQYHGCSPSPLFERWLDVAAARGDELVLHGYTHRDDGAPRGWLDHARRRWYTAGEGEFAALSQREATQRLRAGMSWFAQHGWPLHGFVAPAWLLSEGSWNALDELGFAYTCTLGGLVALPSRERLRSQSIVYSCRSAWRRAVSLGWNAAVARHERDQPLLRLELHPCDAEHPRVLSSWLGLLEEALRKRRALTLAHAAAECFGAHDGTALLGANAR